MIRAASWVSLFLLYFAKVSGAMTFGTPEIFPTLVLLSKTVGVGAFAPIRDVLGDVWIAIRIFADYAMDTDTVIDIGFGAYCISLLWPLYVCVRYYFSQSIDPPRASPASQTLSSTSQVPVSSHSGRGRSPKL